MFIGFGGSSAISDRERFFTLTLTRGIIFLSQLQFGAQICTGIPGTLSRKLKLRFCGFGFLEGETIAADVRPAEAADAIA